MAKEEKIKSIYQGVTYDNSQNRYVKRWVAQLQRKGVKFKKRCGTEREAGLAYDKFLIGVKEEPVNILKRK